MSDQKVDVSSETWQAVLREIEGDLVKLRTNREDHSADVRSLDRDLGGIKMLEKLKGIPERQNEKPPEPIRSSGVRVPGTKHSARKW